MQNPHNLKENDEFHLDSIIRVVRTHWKFIAIITIFVTAIAGIVAVLLPPIYSGKATIMPPQQQSSSVSSLLGQLGGLAGAAGNLAGLKNPNDLYVGMLQSRTVADSIINQYKLQDRYDSETMEDARKTFEKKRKVFSGKDGMISIDVIDKDPKIAAELANAHIRELTQLTGKFAITEASQRRLFFEKQLKSAKDELASAEVNLRKMQENTGMLQLGGQVQGVLQATGQLRAIIAAKEVVFASLRTFATAENPEVLKLSQEISVLKGQLARMESGQQAKPNPFVIPAGKIPAVGVEYVRRLRDVKYYETIFELLAKQYELAKIDEAKDSTTIQQLDIAVPLDKESTSRRKLIPMGGLFAGLAIGLFAAFAREYFSQRSRSVLA